MGEMSKVLKEYYLDEANKHADFLAEKVFKPAFIIAFIHGAKHGREDLLKELNAKEILHAKKGRMKANFNINESSLCPYCQAIRIVRPRGEWQYACECYKKTRGGITKGGITNE